MNQIEELQKERTRLTEEKMKIYECSLTVKREQIIGKNRIWINRDEYTQKQTSALNFLNESIYAISKQIEKIRCNLSIPATQDYNVLIQGGNANGKTKITGTCSRLERKLETITIERNHLLKKLALLKVSINEDIGHYIGMTQPVSYKQHVKRTLIDELKSNYIARNENGFAAIVLTLLRLEITTPEQATIIIHWFHAEPKQ